MSDDDVLAVTELVAYVQMCERWTSDSAWPAIELSLFQPHFFRHTALQLGIAGHFNDAGNRAGLIVEDPSQPQPDVWVSPGHVGDSDPRLSVEVKAPTRLHRPQSPITGPIAEKVVERAFKSGRKQLSSVHAGLLAIGGFNLNDVDVSALGAACRRHFSRTRGSHTNLIGALVFFPRPELWPAGFAGPSGEKIDRLAVPTFAHLVENEVYEGLVRLRA